MSPYAYIAAPGVVYFVGAGPGAPDLITVRGRDIIAQADLILYADSLVEESVARLAHKATARIERSSGLHLEQIIELIVETAQGDGIVARVHSGDPALYGAIHEQMARLDDYGLAYEIVPGVTAAFAAAAQLKTELTVPDVVQTVILTRTAGRTSMPAGEDLQALAASGASLAIYLSISRIRHVVDDLLASGGYRPETPVAVHHKVTWPDESCVVGALADIVEKVKQAGYTKHALILVSPALDPKLKGDRERTSSHLYDKSYTHRFRRAEDFRRGKERQEAAGNANHIIIGEKHLGAAPARQGSVVIAITKRGSQLASKLGPALNADIIIPDKHFEPPPTQSKIQNRGYHRAIAAKSKIRYSGSVVAEIRRRWAGYEHLVLVMPAGVAVRAIAPLLGHKANDPAVICLDEAGQSVIPLLGGHQAGANALAKRIAALTQGQAAITTASDIQGKPALDTPPSSPPLQEAASEMGLHTRQMRPNLVPKLEFGNEVRPGFGKEVGPEFGNELGVTGVGLRGKPWRIDRASALTQASACLVNDEAVGVYVDPALPAIRKQALAWLAAADNVTPVETLDELDLDAYAAGLIISQRPLADHHQHLLRKSVLYRPPILIAGLGCKRDVLASELGQALETTLAEADLAGESLAALATADLKAGEAGLRQLAVELDIPLIIIDSARLAALPASMRAGLSASAAQEKFGLPGVAEPCALLAAGPGGELLIPKRKFERCTVAISMLGQDAVIDAAYLPKVSTAGDVA